MRDVQSTAALLQGASANTARPAAHGFVESVRAYRRKRPLDASAEQTVAAVLPGRKSWSWGPKVTSRSTTRTCALERTRLIEWTQVDEPARERIAKAVIAKVSTYEEDGKVRIPGVARCIVGTK